MGGGGTERAHQAPSPGAAAVRGLHRRAPDRAPHPDPRTEAELQRIMSLRRQAARKEEMIAADQRNLRRLRNYARRNIGTSSVPEALEHADEPPPASETIFAGIVCFCGQRFGPEQAAGFMIHLRAEVGADLQLLAKVREWRRKTAERQRRDRGVQPGEPVTQQQQREKRAAAQRARREATGKPCACGCGEMTRAGRQYRPGHHQRAPGLSARDADAARRYLAGQAVAQICRDLGITRGQADAALKRAGVDRGRKARAH